METIRAWPPDVVLCDIGLPGLDGNGVARALRRDPAMARVRLLALTGYGGARTGGRAERPGLSTT